MYQNIQKLKENPTTENIGKRWSEDEINTLLDEVKNNVSIDDIALNHKRTAGSVNSKLLNIGHSLLIDKKIEMSEVCKIINMSIEHLKDYITKKNKLKEIVKLSNENPDKTITETLSEKIDKKVTEKVNSMMYDLSIFDVLGINKSNSETNTNIIKKEVVLNHEQSNALKYFIAEKSIFLTGPAGTGKSVTLQKIKEHCQMHNINFGICATTGTAAFLISGKTIHSYLGIGLGIEPAKEIYEHVRYKFPHTAKKIRELKVLIIDEISMLDNILFDKISEYLCYMRRSNLPFGGLQLVLTGDFCQLEGVNGDYCFKSEIWSTLKLRTVYLHKQIRQDGDLEFQNMLSKLRYGKCTTKIYDKLLTLKNTEFNEIQPTRLYPRNVDVDRINKQEYEKLIKSGAKMLIYNIEYPKLSKNKEKSMKWIKTLDIPESIELCVGAQIVILANINQDEGIVNGTRGVIIDLKPYCVIIKRIDGSVVEIKYHKSVSSDDKYIFVNFMPMKLAYALSIHKAQGMTLDAIEIDIGNKIFAAGQAYTAISRAKNLKSIKIKDISINSFIVNEDVLTFYKDIEKKIKIKKLKYINNILNILIYNIANHINLDNSLEFVWEFIDSEDEKTLAFFDGYNEQKIKLNMDNYIENNKYNMPIISNIQNITKYMLSNIETVKEKLIEYAIIETE